MKIHPKTTYSVDLYEEPHKNTDHRKKLIETLQFTGLDLVEAIISAGMPDTYLTRPERRKRKDEIAFKIKLFETYVVSDSGGRLSFDTSVRKYLDSTEIGAINYWLGMILITILGRKKYHYNFMVHLSMLEYFSSTIPLKKRTYFSTKGKPTFKSPDLLAVNSATRTYGVFESKGYSSYSKEAMERGYDQVKSIKKVNKKKPNHRLVVMTQTTPGNIKMIQKDPDGENCEINIDYNFLHIYHFLPIVELLTELSHEYYEGRMRASFAYHNEVYHISIPSVLYEQLSTVLNCDNELSASELIESINFRKLQTTQDHESLLCVECG